MCPVCPDTPHGAHPAQCYNYYDYDAEYLRMYEKVSGDDALFDQFFDEWVYIVEDHEAYLNKLGAARILNTKVVPGLGYAPKAQAKGVK